jgi:predicted transposase YdaD
MPVIFDYTDTPAYLEGKAKGEARGEAKGEARAIARNIERLLRNKKLSPQEIADVFEVSLDLVLEIQQKIAKP